jgi:hypothetical protein
VTGKHRTGPQFFRRSATETRCGGGVEAASVGARGADFAWKVVARRPPLRKGKVEPASDALEALVLPAERPKVVVDVPVKHGSNKFSKSFLIRKLTPICSVTACGVA